jgi:hypothetical protein
VKTRKVPVLLAGCLVLAGNPVQGSHQGHEHHQAQERAEASGRGHAVPGASFEVFVERGRSGGAVTESQSDPALRTVIQAFTFMVQHRADYPRFDESLKKEALRHVVIEPTVVNQDGKVFPFLVVRTKEPGRVALLISASWLAEKGYLDHPERLVPALAREFQWVVSKADTARKSDVVSAARDPVRAPIRMDREIQALTADERAGLLQSLFTTYLSTVDDQRSLEAQPYYEAGATTLIPPAQPDSTIKLYDIRVREALHKIVSEPAFMEQTPKAVRSLLNGKIWQVAFVKVDQRDWATRTRVLPEEKAVAVGASGRVIQPASILVNLYRTASPDDPFYRATQGLPMGALSADQLAGVIAWEIEQNIIEKSMRGHVAQDERTAPK